MPGRGDEKIKEDHALIQTFLLVADCKGISEAAQRLDLPRQNVSRQLIRLEEKLKAPLFIRKHTGLSLTETGRRYYFYFREYLDGFYSLDVSLDAFRENAGGIRYIRIGILFGEALDKAILDLVHKFEQSHPEAVVIWEHHDPVQLKTRLLQEELDLIFASEQECRREEEFEQLVLRKTYPMLFVNRDHPLMSPEACAEDFMDEPCYIWNPSQLPDHIMAETIIDHWHMYGVSLANVKVVHNFNSILFNLELNNGFVIHSSTGIFRKNPNLTALPLNIECDFSCFMMKNNANYYSNLLFKFLSENINNAAADISSFRPDYSRAERGIS